MTEPAETLTTWRSRPVFISSTFRDMQRERDWLRDHVFPELEDRLRERRHYLEPIDLRQGVETATMAEERARDLQVLKVCLNEIERSRPFLLVLLGDRYGWVPPTERLMAAAQDAGLDTDPTGKSVTALEIEFGLLKKDPEQRRRSLFYFREPLPYAAMPKAVAAEYSDDYADDPATRAGHERLNALKQTIRDDPELAGRVRPYALGWDAEAQQLTGLEAWGRQVLEALWTELKEETRAYLAQTPTTEAGQDRAQLDEFVEHKLRDFRGRAATLRLLADLARSPAAPGAPWAACLTGPSGSGKSTVFARLYRELVRDAGLFVLAHAAGSGPRTARVEIMLRRWCEELALHLGERSPLTDTTDREEIEQTFARLLHRVAGQRRVVVLLDALNQFEPTPQARHLTWLPKLWPDNARLIATALPGAEAEALGAKHRVTTMTLPALDEAEARDIAESVWARYHRACNPDVLNRVLYLRREDGLPAYSNPLWLTLAMEQLNLLDADDFTAAGQNLHQLLLRKATELPPEVSGLYREMLSRAEKLFGAAWARSFVALIALSRNGWRESDLQALLAPAARLLAPEEPEPVWNPLRFAALRRTFRAQVIQRASHGRWDFSHAQMLKAVEARVLSETALTRRLHAAINDYLEALPLGDPIIPLERMRQLLGEGNRLRAARYYATVDASSTDENTHEKSGATWTLVEWIVARQAEDGANPHLDWIIEWLQESGLTLDQRYRLAESFQFDLLDWMANDTPLPTEQRLIEAVQLALKDLAVTDPVNVEWQRDLSVSQGKLGDALSAQGNLSRALQAYRASLAIAERLMARQPANAQWQHDLSTSRERIGNVLREQGNLAGALEAYRASLAIDKRLVEADPSKAEWQSSLSVSHERIGNVLREQGELTGALEAYRASLVIRERLAAADSSNTAWQRNLSAGHGKVGDVLLDQGDLPWALEAYRASLAIDERLMATDPSNARWQRDLLVNVSRIGDVLLYQGDLAGALEAYRTSLAISERLAAADPAHADRQHDISVTDSKIGHVLREQGELSEALEAYRASLAIRERLASVDPSNALWQRDLSGSYGGVGDVLLDQGDLAGALEAYRTSLAIRERLVSADPSNALWQHDLSVSYGGVGDVLRDQGDLPEALEMYRASLAISEGLVAIDPSNALSQRSLSVWHGRVGDVLRDQGHLAGALEAYRASLTINERLVVADSSNAPWQRDLSISHLRIGKILEQCEDTEAEKHYRIAYEVLVGMQRSGVFLSAQDERLLQKLRWKLSAEAVGAVNLGHRGKPTVFNPSQTTTRPSRPAQSSTFTSNDPRTADLQQVRALLAASDTAAALELIYADRHPSPEVENAHGVCLLRQGKVEAAVKVLQRLVLPDGALSFSADTLDRYKLNFATALLMTDNLNGAENALAAIQDPDQPYAQQLRAAIDHWKQGLSLWQRIGLKLGRCPDVPVTLDFPPGEV